jgi:hypothetical protein
MLQLNLLTVAGAFASLLSCGALAAELLPSFNVDKTQTSVSGLSSGGFMAVQFHTAYSAEVMGAGVIAGGPYNCAYVNWGGIATCLEGAPIGEASYAAAFGFAELGEIDSIESLKRSRVYIFSGTKDSVVAPTVVDATYSYYKTIGVPKSQISYIRTVPAGHAFITPSYGNGCGENASPYINHCTVKGQGYDQAGAILTHIYSRLNAPAASPAGRLIAFDQKAFGGIGMGDKGFLYAPHSCDQGATCRIHVVFHGCRQTPQDIGDQFYTDTGYNRWADTNNILVLYPQVSPDLPSNSQHCWDWWGYTGLQFNVKVAPQMSAVKSMIDKIAK